MIVMGRVHRNGHARTLTGGAKRNSFPRPNQEGKINPDQAKGMVDDLMNQIKSEQGNFESQMERQLRHVLQDLGVPRQSEMDELRGRIDRLERQVRDLENRNWR